jgi:hypothetical protein
MEAYWEQLIKELKQEAIVDGVICMTKFWTFKKIGQWVGQARDIGFEKKIIAF